MGANDSSQFRPSQNQQILDKMVFYDETQTQKFGRVTIYKYGLNPIRYLMLFRQMGIDELKTRNRLIQKQKWYTSLPQHKNIVNIQSIKITETIEMCIRKVSLDIYARYFNVTLEDTIEIKLRRGKRFREGDLFYILESLLSIAHCMHQKLTNQDTGLFESKNIFVSPEGFIKIYPFPLQCESSSKKISAKKKHKYNRSALQNQEVVMDVTQKTSKSVNTISTGARQKANVNDFKEIGFILLQLTLLRKKEDSSTPNIDKPQQLMENLWRDKIVSLDFKNILAKLFERQKEVCLQEVLNDLHRLKQSGRTPFASFINLEQGPVNLQSSHQLIKTGKLKNLSQIKSLIPGRITICSKIRKP